MKKNVFIDYISAAQFRELFITEMGWNNWRGAAELPAVTVDDTTYQLRTIAERSGFQILTCEVEQMPTPSLCRQMDTKIRRSAHDYIAIFVLRGTEHHLWMAPVRQLEKRDIVTIEYEEAGKADFLLSKIDALSFGIDEQTTIVDVKERVQGAFAVNSEKITKDFYAGFRREHNAFAEFISGIDDEIEAKKNRNKQWYTSVMLNRLMFCYFIQKKGFLDGNHNYLDDKLRWCQEERGENRFFGSFYRGFLTHLFSDGLNAPRHELKFEQVYGKIPYLNGGMFDQHQLERDYRDIDIRDEAFERLFMFFDKWRWHLDTRISASGRDINPDVLGYIFEQYINDRAEMGAYYTKEDITEYIGRSCIVPFLMDSVEHSTDEMAREFRCDGEVWTFLRQSGDRYVFDAVKHGYSSDWRSQLPDNIACGLLRPDEDASKPVAESNLNLLERRKDWNRPTPEPFALPTEIWRETIERLQRCEEVIGKITRGEITAVNDFITYNLDIRQFVYDLLERTANHRLVCHFYHALQSVTILDPTCGSGAFLFAAMNILEPLYEVCINRMQEFNEQNPKLFADELGEITHKYRSNQQYFIFKSIILRNLYGVDIMHEAVEIAKLRLFLKMVAVVDADRRRPNLGLDPLPDIDFNIRCGNTLVGYATDKEVMDGVNYGDMFAREEFKAKIETEMETVSTAYDHFRTEQLAEQDNLEQVKAAKTELRQRLAQLTSLLDRQMFMADSGDCDIDNNIFAKQKFDAWRATHQPFHWIAEYYSIIHGKGGFDVIIGNPPYVEYNKKSKDTGKAVSDLYQLKGYKTIDCGNLYAYVLERCKSLISDASYIGMIVPLSGHSTERMSPLVTNFYKKFGLHLHLNLSADANPQRLFEGVKFRLAIFFVSNAHKGCYSTKYTRWLAEERKYLFSSVVKYNDEQGYEYGNIIPKVSSPLFVQIAQKVSKQSSFFYNSGTYYCLYNDAPVNWMRSHAFTPYFQSERDGEIVSRHLKKCFFHTKEEMECGCAVLNSSLFFIWWISHSSCYNVNSPELQSFRLSLSQSEISELASMNNDLTKDMLAHSRRRVYVYKATGRVEYDEFYMKLSKPIIDEIDKVLARHYGFTEEELDFILNYDIKYRMGDELNKETEE